MSFDFSATERLLTPGERDRLIWRCRRGMLENDLLLERFFSRYSCALTVDHAAALSALMALSDNDLLDLFLSRTQPSGEINVPGVREVLAQIRAGTLVA